MRIGCMEVRNSKEGFLDKIYQKWYSSAFEALCGKKKRSKKLLIQIQN